MTSDLSELSQLDRLLELFEKYCTVDDYSWNGTKEEYKSLKSRLEEQLELGEYAGHMKKYADEFKQQVKQLQEENQFLKETCGLCAEEQENLKAKLEKLSKYIIRRDEEEMGTHGDWQNLKTILDEI